MNERQRFLASLSFQPCDRLTLEPGFPRESTLAAWRQQGLPEGVDWYSFLLGDLGIELPASKPSIDPGVDFRIIPQFEEKVLAQQDGHFIVQDWMGAVTEISDQFDYTYIRSAKDFVTRKWHHFPVETGKDWEEKIVWRYNLDSEGRFPDDFGQRASLLRQRDYPLRLSVNGPFWQMREWCGFEGLCTLMAQLPAFVEEMADFWRVFVSQMFERILREIVPDYVIVNEDMAYKEHSMISPRMVERFLMHSWSEWVAQLTSHGVPLVFIDSDGYVGELIPLWIEAGFNGNFPIEVAAGNDIVAYRKIYGRMMAYQGGIDKRALAAGGEIMRQEVHRVVLPLLVEGGFIPGCDHGVPPDISWENFSEYTRLLAELTGWL
jgi:hypothetical protein